MKSAEDGARFQVFYCFAGYFEHPEELLEDGELLLLVLLPPKSVAYSGDFAFHPTEVTERYVSLPIS